LILILLKLILIYISYILYYNKELNQAYSKKKKVKTTISLNQIKDAIDVVQEDIKNTENSGVAPKLSKNSRKNLA